MTKGVFTMTRLTTILMLFLLALKASSTLAQPIPQVNLAPSKEKPTIAVTTFENLSAFPENAWVAMSFSESLTVKLKRLYERFIVVERLKVYEVIREQGFDPEKVDSLEATKQQKVGSLIGANYLILGSVSLQGSAE
jgi:TolB-like protein